MRRTMWLVLLVVTAATAGWAYYRYGRATTTAPVVNSTAVTRGSVVATVDATGTLEAVTTVQVGTQVSGTIKTLRADFNSKVRQGQVIAELDTSLFDTQVEQARATLTRLTAETERARIQLDDTQVKLRRARELFDRKLLPANDLETAESNARLAEAAVKAAEAQVVQARASLNQAEVNISHTIIRAPIDGVVIARNVDVGQTVAASMQAPTLFVLARDLTAMRVNASIDESDIGVIASGQPVRFRVDAYPDDTFTGTVSQVRLQPQVQQNVVSYITVIDVPNPDLRLKPGMTATVSIETARVDDVLRVPNAALRFRPTEETFAALGQPAPAPATPATAAPPAAGRGATAPVPADEEGDAALIPPAVPQPRGTMTEEQRAAMRERLAAMSPEAREAFLAERRDARTRGAGAGTGGAAAAGAAGQRPAARPRPAGSGAPRPATLWLLDNGALREVHVRAGLSDGTQTAVFVRGDELPDGARVVTSVVTTAAAPASTAPASSPLIPTPPRGRGGR